MKRNLFLVLGATLVFLVVWGVVTVYDYLMPVGRMWETPAVRPHENPILIMADDIVPVSGGEAQYRLADPLTLTSPFDAKDAQVLHDGQALYFTFCQQCHGPNHDGQGTVGQSFAPLPTDIRSARVQALADGVLFHHISYGVPDPKGRQPALATTILAEERWKIVHFMKSLGVRP